MTPGTCGAPCSEKFIGKMEQGMVFATFCRGPGHFRTQSSLHSVLSRQGMWNLWDWSKVIYQVTAKPAVCPRHIPAVNLRLGHRITQLPKPLAATLCVSGLFSLWVVDREHFSPKFRVFKGALGNQSRSSAKWHFSIHCVPRSQINSSLVPLGGFDHRGLYPWSAPGRSHPSRPRMGPASAGVICGSVRHTYA